MSLERIARNRCFGGWLERYRHRSETLDCDMIFAVCSASRRTYR